MKHQLPEPLKLHWTCKSIDTACSGYEILSDGRIHCWIEYDILHGVTPQMLVWWFKHLEGDILHDGQCLNRYRVWHPRDHVALKYARRNPDGSIGVGCVIHLTEMLGANPDYLVDVHTEITKLDEQPPFSGGCQTGSMLARRPHPACTNRHSGIAVIR